MTETQWTSEEDDIIRVERIPFDENIPLGKLKGIAKKWFKEKYRGKSFINRGTGREIEISGKGIGHTISETYNIDVVYSMAALPEMIERMKFVGTDLPKQLMNGEAVPQNFLGVERYRARVQVREKVYEAHFVIKVERVGGKKVARMVRLYYYNHRLT